MEQIYENIDQAMGVLDSVCASPALPSSLYDWQKEAWAYIRAHIKEPKTKTCQNDLEKIALFDMDGTLCDYESRLIRDLNNLRSPSEAKIEEVPKDDVPEYLRTRMNLIRASVEWWAKLPQLKLGFDVWNMIESYGYRKMILTQGPKRNPNAWSGKKKWIDVNLGQDVDITITRDKGLVYGKILVDDWPEYILRWLTWRPRGLVIMPAGVSNKYFVHPQVIRYDGSEESSRSIHEALETIESIGQFQ